MRQQEYIIALNLVPGLGNIKIINLLKRFSCVSEIFTAHIDELLKKGNLEISIARHIQTVLESEIFKNELRQINRLKVKIVTIIDSEYPECLKQIYNPPVVLYVLGDVSILSQVCIGVVGCRRASFYGLTQAERISAELSVKGVCVVSGLAIGIDTAAHKGALSGTGKTIAVLGSGLGNIYPLRNKELAFKIIKQGAIVSEFPLLTPPLQNNFPRRNRIISGLCKALVVVEAAKRSGSLITANFALEQNRDVYAVPGAANSINAQGTNKLIQQGAKLVQNGQDVLEDLNIVFLDKLENITCKSQCSQITEETKKILAFLSANPLHIDIIIKQLDFSPACIYKGLLELQLKGMVKELSGKMFIRV
ncbi:MAG: DNA-protecting protein DprA [Candidatus Omnitrophota bacterium]|nr:MAG: DNA-protecting protein DprA [Candidatus Omnitrophota bacterium]